MSNIMQNGHNHKGIIIGLAITGSAVLLGMLYLWGGTRTQSVPEPFNPPENNEPETPRADADIQILRTVSSSDEIVSIEADLESTNLDALDRELELIEQDLAQ